MEAYASSQKNGVKAMAAKLIFLDREGEIPHRAVIEEACKRSVQGSGVPSIKIEFSAGKQCLNIKQFAKWLENEKHPILAIFTQDGACKIIYSSSVNEALLRKIKELDSTNGITSWELVNEYLLETKGSDKNGR
jgi:hypothetical protein